MKIRLASLIHDSIVDGEGLRSVVFTQGCPHNCPGCHNPESIPFDGGLLLNVDDVLEDILQRDLKKLTFSGGEPFVQARACYEIAKRLKEEGYSLWSYTGFTFESLLKHRDPYILKFLETLDILIDGRFILEEKSLAILFRGSRNQRIIDVPKSLKLKEAVVSEKYIDPIKSPKAQTEGLYI